MPASVIQTFLRANLLDLGGDDLRLSKLQAAATDLARTLASKPTSAMPVFLGAINFAGSKDDDASFEEVAKAIEDEWTTYKSAFQGGEATTVYRAVALQAIVEAIDLLPSLGTAVTFVMRNFAPFVNAGKVEPAIEIVLAAAKAAFAQELEHEMSDSSAEPPTLAAAAKPVKLDRAILQKRIEAAVGPSNKQSESTEGPNPHWPNEGPPWAYQFSDKLVAIVADHIDFALQKSAEMDGKNQSAVATRFNADIGTDQNLKRATNMLWWRQALYSPSAEQPYRSLPPLDATVHAVCDLSDLLPTAYEPAVDSFLSEAILHFLPSEDKLPLSDLLKASELPIQSLLERLKSDPPKGLVLAALHQDSADYAIVNPSLALHQWAVWLLRELIALQALDYADPVPKKDGQE